MDHEGVILAFLANVSCRISRASGGFAPWTPNQGSVLEPLGAQSAPRPRAAGNNDCWSLYVVTLAQHSYLMCSTNNRLRENISILMGKLRENG